MALSLKDLRTVESKEPPRILTYGPHGMGKTTLGNEFPDNVFIQIEDGTPSKLKLNSWGRLKSFDQVMEAIGALYAEEHQFKTLCVDGLDKLEPLIWEKTCKDNNWANIEQPGYGKGYLAADHVWRDFLEGLGALRNDRGMTYCLIAHSDVERFDDPSTASYSRYDIRLHKRARALIQDEMDAIFFVNQDATIKTEEQGFNKKRTRAEGGRQHYIYARPRPSINAKNRYGIPEKVPFKEGQGYAALAPYFPGADPSAAPQEAPAEAGAAE